MPRHHPALAPRPHPAAATPRLPAASTPAVHGHAKRFQSLTLRLARENLNWGYRRIHGELTMLGITVASFTVWEILKTHGIEPTPQHNRHVDDYIARARPKPAA